MLIDSLIVLMNKKKCFRFYVDKKFRTNKLIGYLKWLSRMNQLGILKTQLGQLGHKSS